MNANLNVDIMLIRLSWLDDFVPGIFYLVTIVIYDRSYKIP